MVLEWRAARIENRAMDHPSVASRFQGVGMEQEDIKHDAQGAEAAGQSAGEETPVLTTTAEATPTTGKRLALRDLRRQLTMEELASPGAQKMLLEELERADAECESLRAYETRYHEADKRAAVLEERLRTQTALEIAFGVGVALGGAIMGLAPGLWTLRPFGHLALLVGAVLVVGASVARVVKR